MPEGFWPVDLMQLKEAVASVALDHPDECPCMICAAVDDEAAFLRLAAKCAQYPPLDERRDIG